MKRCGSCGQTKPLIEFHRKASSADGHSFTCKPCCASYQAAYRASHLEAKQAYRRRYLAANKAAITAKKRRQYVQDREKIIRRAVQWQRDHPDRVILRSKLRRARERGNGGDLTQAEWRALCAHYGHRCLACGRKTRLEPDHVVPVALGGRGDIANIQPLCRSCNARKGTRTIDYRTAWAQNNAARQLSLFGEHA